jgi:hypothetical protein
MSNYYLSFSVCFSSMLRRWDVRVYDVGLLMAVLDYGINSL